MTWDAAAVLAWPRPLSHCVTGGRHDPVLVDRVAASSEACPAGASDSTRPCPGAIEPIPLAGRPMLADATLRVLHQQARSAPLMRFIPLQRSLTTLRYPGQPATGQSRFGVGTIAPGWRSFALAPGRYRSSPLRFSA